MNTFPSIEWNLCWNWIHIYCWIWIRSH